MLPMFFSKDSKKKCHFGFKTINHHNKLYHISVRSKSRSVVGLTDPKL